MSTAAETTTTTATVASAIAAAALACGLGFARRGLGGSEGFAFDDGVGDALDDELDGAHAVVVAGDREVDQVGVAVGVEEGDDLDAELAGFGDGDILAVGVDDEEGFGEPGHVADAGEVAVDLGALAGERGDHLLGVAEGLLAIKNRLELFEAFEAAADGAEIGEGAAEPTLGDVRH